MITNKTNPPSYDSAIVDDTLVNIFPVDKVFNPAIPGVASSNAGAGATTLPGSYKSGSALMAGNGQGSPLSGTGTGDNTGTPLGAIAGQFEQVLGIPSVAFYILLFGAVAYLVLWKVHFHALVED